MVNIENKNEKAYGNFPYLFQILRKSLIKTVEKM